MYQLPAVADRSVAGEVRDVLLEFISQEDAVDIDASQVERISSSVLQLLVAMRLQAEEEQKKVVLVNPSEVFKDAARSLGIKKILGIVE